MSNLVSVQYQSKDDPELYAGREYTYIAGIDLSVGELVIAPVGKDESVARVSAVNVPESKVDERIMPLLKTIQKRFEDSGARPPDEAEEAIEMKVEDL